MGDVLAFRRPHDDRAVDHRPVPSQQPGRRDDAPPQPTGTAAEPLWRELAGRELRSARQRRDQTLVQVANRAGVSVPYLSEIERGRKEPSSEVLAAVTGALDLTLLDLTSAVARQLIGVRQSRPRPVPRHTDPVALAA